MKFDRVKLLMLRKEKGMTQQEVADKIGYKREVVTRIETGTYHNITIELVNSLADALGVKFDDLMMRE